MTEQEWLTSDNPLAMWYERRARNHRKRRLVAYACARRVLSLLNDDARAVALIEACERYTDGHDADGPKNWKGVLAARRTFRVLYDVLEPRLSVRRCYALNAVGAIASADACGAWPVFAWAQNALKGRRPKPVVPERIAQLAILRDVFGNPFRSITFSPSWRTDTAVALARTMYDSHDFSAMPILADALQDAGCDSDDVLNHCRGAKQIHVRGCWVVDLVLGKT